MARYSARQTSVNAFYVRDRNVDPRQLSPQNWPTLTYDGQYWCLDSKQLVPPCYGFFDGVYNVSSKNTFEQGWVLAVPDPTEWIVIWEDFLRYRDVDWTSYAQGAASTATLTDGNGGVLLITNDANNNDHYFLQKKGAAWRWSPTKRMLFRTRFNVHEANRSDVIIGLQITSDPLAVTDGLFFYKADRSRTVHFLVEKDSTADDLPLPTNLQDDTTIDLSFFYDPDNVKFQIFHDGVEVGYVQNNNAPDDEDLTISFGIQNGRNVPNSMRIDYLYCALER